MGFLLVFKIYLFFSTPKNLKPLLAIILDKVRPTYPSTITQTFLFDLVFIE